MSESAVLTDPPPPDTPAAFCAHTNPACPKAVAQSRIYHAELDFWVEFLSAPDDDFDVAVATMVTATGLERKTVRSRFAYATSVSYRHWVDTAASSNSSCGEVITT